jgi:hypothetical protein
MAPTLVTTSIPLRKLERAVKSLPPEGWRHHFTFPEPFGNHCLGVALRGDEDDGEEWDDYEPGFESFCYGRINLWEDLQPDWEESVEFESAGFEVVAVDLQGYHRATVGLAWTGEWPEQDSENGWNGRGILLRSELDAAVKAGYSLIANGGGVRYGAGHLCLGSTLTVNGGLPNTLPGGGAMLDGPFSDATFIAGGRTFRAHRIVLAAASPVFLRMLDGGMREALEAAVELLLRHIYGAAIEVPLPLALPLYALADQYQLSSGLQQQLRLWLLAARLTTEAICTLLPVAWTVCRPVSMRLKADAIEALGKLEGLEQVPPSIAAWPFDVLRGVVYSISIPYWAFATAAVWVEGLPNCSAEAAAAPTGEEAAGNRRDRWPELLGAMRWHNMDSAEYKLFRRHPAAPAVPGLLERLADTMHQRLMNFEENPRQ